MASARETGKRGPTYPGAIGFVSSSTACRASFVDVVYLSSRMEPATGAESVDAQVTANDTVEEILPQQYDLSFTKHAHDTDEGVLSTRTPSEASSNSDIKAPDETSSIASKFDAHHDEYHEELNAIAKRVGAEELASSEVVDAATPLNRDLWLSRRAYFTDEAVLSNRLPSDAPMVSKIQMPSEKSSPVSHSNASLEAFQTELRIIAKRVGSGELALRDAVGIIKSYSVVLPAGAGYAPFRGLTRQTLSEPKSDIRRRMAALLPALVEAGTVSHPGTMSSLSIKGTI